MRNSYWQQQTTNLSMMYDVISVYVLAKSFAYFLSIIWLWGSQDTIVQLYSLGVHKEVIGLSFLEYDLLLLFKLHILSSFQVHFWKETFKERALLFAFDAPINKINSSIPLTGISLKDNPAQNLSCSLNISISMLSGNFFSFARFLHVRVCLHSFDDKSLIPHTITTAH